MKRYVFFVAVIICSKMSLAQSKQQKQTQNTNKENIIIEYLSSFGVSFNNNYIGFSWPNVHLKTFYQQRFSKVDYHIDSRGLYGGFYGTGGNDEFAFGLRFYYLFKPSYEKFQYYPLFQIGYDNTGLDSDPIKLELRLGGGISYRIKGGIAANIEVGTGITPILLGITLTTNKTISYKKNNKK